MTNKIRKVLKKTKNILFADPKLLYKEENYLVNKPFYLPGTSKKAILLIHGWTATSYELRRLARYLNTYGYTVSGPMLKGHGTVPKDLEGIRWPEWLDQIEEEYLKLKENYEKVYIGGTSIGSNLAIMLAKKHPEIAGLILMATPYKMRAERFVLPFAKLMYKLRKYNKKHYPPTFGAADTITRIISYQTYPISSAMETFKLIMEARKDLDKINQPCFLLQSSSDHIVSQKSIENIYEKISSKVKKMKYIRRAYHTFISDIKNEGVFKEIRQFLDEN